MTLSDALHIIYKAATDMKGIGVVILKVTHGTDDAIVNTIHSYNIILTINIVYIIIYEECKITNTS